MDTRRPVIAFNWYDIAVFAAFIGFVIVFSIWKSRHETSAEDYFLASRGLRWWLIGFSIVAANISTEQFVGMAGSSAGNVGLAVSAYQLNASFAVVIIALFFLPRFLRAGIYTMPQYLEYRYNAAARGIMAFYTMIIYVAVTAAAVLYSGGLTLHTIFGVSLAKSVAMIAFVATLYTVWGGLKAAVWADLIQGSGLLIGGLVTAALGFYAVGGVPAFFAANGDRLHMILPADHPELPWTALVAGLWIPEFYYCGLNQFIVQKTLAAKNLREGQLGIILAAALWLLIPLAIVVPGIMAVQLYGEMATPDMAYPLLIKNLIPTGLRGFIFAVLAGAVISSIASVLNAAATIFTIDLYQRYLRPAASQTRLIVIGRVSTVAFVIVGGMIALQLSNPAFRGVFHYIQEFQGYISPGILAAFVFGFVFKRAPAAAGVSALVLCAPVYGFLHYFYGQVAFLNRMAITFAVICAVMAAITLLRPLSEPKVMPVNADIDMRPAPSLLWLGGVIIAAVVAFYAVFW